LPTLKPYTFAIRSSQQHKPKIAKEYVLLTLSAEREEQPVANKI